MSGWNRWARSEMAQVFASDKELKRIMEWAVGPDWEVIPLQLWDDRIRERTGLDVWGTDEIIDSLRRVRQFYYDNSAPRSAPLPRAELLLMVYAEEAARR